MVDYKSVPTKSKKNKKHCQIEDFQSTTVRKSIHLIDQTGKPP